MKRILMGLWSIALVLCFSRPSMALLLTGQDIIDAPQYVTDDYPGARNWHQQAFNENQNVLLEENLLVDGGIIAAGTYVSSHMIFLNTPCYYYVSDKGVEWTFDNDILGVMSDGRGIYEAASSRFLGAPGTVYPHSFWGRGLECGDGYVVDANMIRVCMTVTEPGDWIRVITRGQGPSPVPEPATMLLLGFGLIGIAGLGRKKQK